MTPAQIMTTNMQKKLSESEREKNISAVQKSVSERHKQT